MPTSSNAAFHHAWPAALAAALCLITCAAPATASPTATQKCVAAKLKAAGKAGGCRGAVASKAVKKHTAADYARCDERQAGIFAKAEAKGATQCTTTSDASLAATSEASCLDAVFGDLGGVPGSVANRCAAKKVKSAGKAFQCNLKAASKATRKGIATDTTKCADKLAKVFGKAEERGNCTTTGDAGSITAALADCTTDLAGDLAGSPSFDPTVAASLTPPPWPTWVLEHWVWENEGDQTSALALVDDYLAHDVPVGAAIIDRPWEVEPTAFEPDPALYPDLGTLVDDMHMRGVHVFMWAVSMVNETASTFAEAETNDYLLGNAALIDWWAGTGALLDYTNPAAVDWWHGLMDNILDLGIDGWKCDGVDPYVSTLTNPVGLGGTVTWDDYRDAYYRDFFEYTRSRLGPDRVITARPSDSYVGLPIQVPFAPPDVNFAGWVGDQDGDFGGLEAALANMLASSQLGYVNFGSDIGGFRGSGLRDREVFVRWAQLGALSGVMENGGGGEHRPWMYDSEVLDVYRTFTVLHHELIPYLYGQGARSWEDGRSVMRFQPADTSYSYMLGDDLLVAPFLEAGTSRNVTFPAGRWIEWLDESTAYDGPATETLDFPLATFPVFVREGAIVPLDVNDASTGHGDTFSQGQLTVAVYPGPGGRNGFDLYEQSGSGVHLGWRRSGPSLILEASPTGRALLWRVRGGAGPQSVVAASGAQPVEVGSTALLTTAARTWTRDGDLTWIRIADVDQGVSLTLDPQ
jgi:hypothetical protein